MRKAVDLPYFDYLLKLLHDGNAAVEQCFGRHVHWGYWERPQEAVLTGDDFADAVENLSKEICQAGFIENGQQVLDIGCGFGGTIAHLNENYTDMQLTGLNLDARQLRRAITLMTPRSGNRIDFVQGDACRLPFPDRSFEIVLAVECIFHFPSRQSFYREAWRVLKPGGYLALSDFVPAPAIAPFTKIRLPASLTRGFYGRCNVQYTREKYRRLAGDSGFAVVSERDITQNTLPTYSYLRRLARTASFYNGFAMIETATLELLSRLNLLKYYIFALRKSG